MWWDEYVKEKEKDSALLLYRLFSRQLVVRH